MIQNGYLLLLINSIGKRRMGIVCQIASGSTLRITGGVNTIEQAAVMNTDGQVKLS
jgi:hypothetical protein